MREICTAGSSYQGWKRSTIPSWLLLASWMLTQFDEPIVFVDQHTLYVENCWITTCVYLGVKQSVFVKHFSEFVCTVLNCVAAHLIANSITCFVYGIGKSKRNACTSCFVHSTYPIQTGQKDSLFPLRIDFQTIKSCPRPPSRSQRQKLCSGFLNFIRCCNSPSSWFKLNFSLLATAQWTHRHSSSDGISGSSTSHPIWGDWFTMNSLFTIRTMKFGFVEGRSSYPFYLIPFGIREQSFHIKNADYFTFCFVSSIAFGLPISCGYL